jgi:hypothetical protein
MDVFEFKVSNGVETMEVAKSARPSTVTSKGRSLLSVLPTLSTLHRMMSLTTKTSNDGDTHRSMLNARNQSWMTLRLLLLGTNRAYPGN